MGTRLLGLMILLSLLALAAGPAPAVVDPDPDCVGLYFDPDADLNCVSAVPYSTIKGYLVLTHPTMDAICGYEVGCDFTGQAMVLSLTFPSGVIPIEHFFDNLIMTFGQPLACTEATVLVTASILYMDTTLGPLEFFLHGTTPSSLDPALPSLLLPDLSIVSTGLSTPPGTACAVINGECVVADEAVTWDGIKSLYR